MKKRILVVDDEPIITNMIMRILSASPDYQVESVSDPLEARDRASRNKYDLVISDVQMPNMSGDLLYCCMDTDPETGAKTLRRPKMLLMSGAFDDQELRERREKIGAACHLQKPFQPSALVTMVDSMLKDS